MRRRALSWGWLACALVGCWSDESRVDGFTAEQWEALRDDYAQPTFPATCLGQPASCEASATLGHKLFFEPKLSHGDSVSCATCHAPTAWFVDTRVPNAVSVGAVKPTAHNTISLVNLALKPNVTWTGACTPLFSTTSRRCESAEDVITDIALPRAMSDQPENAPPRVAKLIRDTGDYAMFYTSAFGTPLMHSDLETYNNVAKALARYSRKLASLSSPFDAYIAGDPSSLSESARRGFTLFVGKAMCAECHSGSRFTDGQGHVTGVQSPRNTPDAGIGGKGGFFTPPLRHIEMTGPYMHDGSLATLADVIAFYRRGGDSIGFVGVKDPLMQPLEITDDEARDLEAFLRALTGQPVPDALSADIRCAGGSCAL
jgi:cytochrome c peroxidase